MNMKQGWTYKKLGDVGNIITGSTPSTQVESNYSSKDYCFVKPSDLPKSQIGIIPIIKISLQQEFAKKIEAVESMKAKVRQSLKESEQLFNSRMDYYFN